MAMKTTKKQAEQFFKAEILPYLNQTDRPLA